MSEIEIWSLVIQTIYKFLSTLRNLEMTNDTNDPTARRRRIVERGSDRLALITGARVTNQPSSSSSETAHHSYNASCPPSVTRLPDQPDENKAETAVCKVQPVLRKSGSTKVGSSRESSTKSREIQSSPNQSTHQTTSKQKIYLYKTVSPSQLRPAILASQETRRKCSFFAGVVALLSHIGFPILGSYVIRSIILSRPLLLLLLINVAIIFGPILLDAIKVIQQEANNGPPTSEVDIPDNLGSPFEWGMLFKTGLSAFFMDSCIYSVVVICGMSILQKFGL